jgi:ABC-2 type transport system ATP-binding protein
MLDVQHLHKDFSTTRAVDDVSFHVGPGEIFGLLGPNGAGKTTTIRIVLRIIEPDGGTVLFRGQPFSEPLRNSIGYLPEERGLYRRSRLMDTILYLAGLRGMPHGAARAEAARWLDRFGLGDRAASRIQELSKGNQQKVQFIAALIHDPDLVILDEPFSGLDPVNQLLFQEVVQDLKRAGKAVIFSTHQMEQAERLSDSLCLINRGRVVLAGTVADVKRKHGHNTLHVEFQGDGGFLRTLPGLQGAIVYQNAAELSLRDSTSVQELLRIINESVQLRKVELREPSLHSIFVQTVAGKEEAQPQEVRP